MSRFLYPVTVDAEEKAKRFLTGLVALLTLPLLLGYCVFNFCVHDFYLSAALFLATLLISAAILTGRKKVDLRKDHEGEIKVAETGPDGTTLQIRLPFLQAAVPE